MPPSENRMPEDYPYDGEAWDEERWEAFLRDNDQRVDRYVDLFFHFFSDLPAPDPEEPPPAAKRNPPDDLGDPLGDELFFDEEDPADDFRALPIYQQAFRLGTDVLDWANGLAGHVKDSTLVHFCAHAMQIAANIARGHGIGRDRDGLGGNIACAKRGLHDANAALDLLHQMKSAAYMDAPTYRRLYEETFETRNAVGLYIQDLRARFDLGID